MYASSYWASARIQSDGWLPTHEPSRSKAPPSTFYFHVGRLTVQANVPRGCTMSAMYIETATTRLRDREATISTTPHDCIASLFTPTSSSTRLSFELLINDNQRSSTTSNDLKLPPHTTDNHDAFLTSESAARPVDCRCCCAV